MKPALIPEFGKCVQCGRKFVPNWLEITATFSSCCATCVLLNMERFMAEPEPEPEKPE